MEKCGRQRITTPRHDRQIALIELKNSRASCKKISL